MGSAKESDIKKGSFPFEGALSQAHNIVALCVLVFSVIMVFYSPIFFHKFAYHNDYRIWDYNVHNCCLGYLETKHLFAIGRPILGFLLNIQLMFVNNMSSLQWMHALSVVLIGIAATLFFLLIQNRLNINRYNATLLSVLIFTLPSMAINSFWVVNLGSEILPLFIVLLAYFLIGKTIQYTQKALIFAIVFSLIFISLLIYPPTTLFFATLIFIKFLFGEKEADKTKLTGVFLEVMVLLLACGAYFLSIRYIYKPFLLQSNFGGFNFQEYYQLIESSYSEYSFSLFSNLSQKIAQCQDLLILIFSAWFPPLRGSWVTLLVLGFILILIKATLSNSYLTNLRIAAKASAGFAIFIFLFLLTAIPVLAGPSKFEISYRTIFASMAIIPSIIVFVFDRALLVRKSEKVRFFNMLLMTLLILTAEITSLYRLMLVVERSSREYNNVLNAVSHDVFEESKEIRIPPTPPVTEKEKKFLHRDFALIGMNITLPGIIRAATQEIGLKLDDYQIVSALGPRYNATLSEGIVFNRDGEPRFIRNYSGISEREGFGRWTDGKKAIIEFVLPLPKEFTLKITAGASPTIIDMPIKITIGNTRLKVKFTSQTPTEVALNVATDGSAKSIVFEFPNVKSPKEIGLSSDTRLLGLALIKLQIFQKN